MTTEPTTAAAMLHRMSGSFYDPELSIARMTATPQAAYVRSAARCPLRRNDDGSVTVLRMADVNTLNRHKQVLGNGHSGGGIGAVRRRLIPLDLDGPEHRKYRKLIDPLFTVKRLAPLEPAIWMSDYAERPSAIVSLSKELDALEDLAVGPLLAGPHLTRADAALFPSVALLDATMPGLDGEEALREIHEIRADVPVVISSGYEKRAVIGRFDGHRVSGFVQKPYTAEALLGVVRRALEPPARSTSAGTFPKGDGCCCKNLGGLR